jgi:hypothetical protein
MFSFLNLIRGKHVSYVNACDARLASSVLMHVRVDFFYIYKIHYLNILLGFDIHTHTHTHTHIYIYIYIYRNPINRI